MPMPQRLNTQTKLGLVDHRLWPVDAPETRGQHRADKAAVSQPTLFFIHSQEDHTLRVSAGTVVVDDPALNAGYSWVDHSFN